MSGASFLGMSHAVRTALGLALQGPRTWFTALLPHPRNPDEYCWTGGPGFRFALGSARYIARPAHIEKENINVHSCFGIHKAALLQ